MEIRRSYDRLISTLGFPLLVRWHLFIESGPRPSERVLCRHSGDFHMQPTSNVLYGIAARKLHWMLHPGDALLMEKYGDYPGTVRNSVANQSYPENAAWLITALYSTGYLYVHHSCVRLGGNSGDFAPLWKSVHVPVITCWRTIESPSNAWRVLSRRL